MKAKIICTTLLVEKSPQALPLGAACIASAIKSHPLTKDFCSVQLKDFFPIENGSSKKMISAQEIANDLLLAFKNEPADYNICAFSVFVWNKNVMEEAASILKKEGIICIAGGPEITAHPQDFSVFDYLTTGEGENKVPQIIYKICKNEEPPVIQDFDNSTGPYLDGTLDPGKYGGVLWELARGCPFKCSYCYESKGATKVCAFPMERITKELDLFAKKNVPQVFVLDPTYNANKKRAIELINLIAKKTPNTFYYFEARAEFIDRELANAFTKIPCALQIGLQSAEEKVLQAVHRPFNKKLFTKNIGFLNDAGVIFGLDLIYGLPFETFKTFCQGIDFAISLYPNNLEIFCLSVLPGTDLYDRAKELHLTYQTEPPYNVIHTDCFSNADIENATCLSKACGYFYNQGRAVPWFNTITKALRIRPSEFFKQFYKFHPIKDSFANICDSHKDIEKVQIEFVTKLFKEKNLSHMITAATDIIRFNGAISRTLDTGKQESVNLNYPAQYIDSPYATDLPYFVANVKRKTNTVRMIKQGNYVDWK